MVPDMTDRDRRDRLAADLELLGKIGDPTRGPLARYYLPPPPPIVLMSHPSAPLPPWRRALVGVLAMVQRDRGHRLDRTRALLNQRLPAKRPT